MGVYQKNKRYYRILGKDQMAKIKSLSGVYLEQF